MATTLLTASPGLTAPQSATVDLLTSVTLAGTPTIGGTLKAVTTPALDGADPSVRYRFVWKDGDVPLTGYTGSTMYLNWLQYGSTLSLTVTATGPDGVEQSATSTPVGPITAVGTPSAVTLGSTGDDVTAAGTPTVAATTVSTRHGDVSLERTWLRDGVPVAATGQTEKHVFGQGDSGHRLSFRLTARQPASGYTGSLASPSTPVVGTITPAPFRLTPTTSVKQLETIDIDLASVSRTLYPPTDADCTWTPTWYRDGQAIPNFPYVYKQVQTTEGGARITATIRTTCKTLGGVTFTPSVKAASNTVTVTGRPVTWTPWGPDSYRDVVVRRSQQKHYQAFYGNKDYGPYQLDYVEELPEFDGMTRVVTGGDLNGDSEGDALAQTSTGDLYLYTVGGDTSRRLWKVGSGWGSMNLVFLAGDLDGNHAGDILARRASDGALLLYSGNGARVLPGRVVGTGFRTATKIAVSPDVTGDSIPDLYATWPDGSLRMYPGTGRGGFRSGVVVGWSGWNSMAFITDGGDANGDGKGDLYAVDRSNRAWVYYGKGNGTLGSRAVIANGWYFTAFR